jgi:hypothetical protein
VHRAAAVGTGRRAVQEMGAFALAGSMLVAVLAGTLGVLGYRGVTGPSSAYGP